MRSIARFDLQLRPRAAIKTCLGSEIRIMGSIGDQQNVGNSTYHIQGLANNGTGGTDWAARQWGNQGVY